MKVEIKSNEDQQLQQLRDAVFQTHDDYLYSGLDQREMRYLKWVEAERAFNALRSKLIQNQ